MTTDGTTPTRRGVLKSGALGLGSVAGAITLSGLSVHVADADPLTGAPLSALASGGAAEYFLSIDGILGESRDDRHRDWIDVLSFSWAASRPSSSAGTSTSRATLSDLFFTFPLGTASPKLFLATMQGRTISKATLEGVTSGEARATFMRLELDNVVITSYQSGGANTAPFDNAAMSFGKITFTYWEQKADGSVGAEVKVTWDVRTNTGS